MDFLSIFIISVGLAMDCFAVSISRSIGAKRFAWKRVLLMAGLFGLFQGGMPLIAYFAGAAFTEQITRLDHLIALVLLGFIGGKMVWESMHHKEKEEEDPKHVNIKTLLLLAVATSVDALATGVIFVPFPDIVYGAVVLIGAVSLFFSLLGGYIGYRVGKHFTLNVELIGGLILIGIGIKIFIAHLWL